MTWITPTEEDTEHVLEQVLAAALAALDGYDSEDSQERATVVLNAFAAAHACCIEVGKLIRERLLAEHKAKHGDASKVYAHRPYINYDHLIATALWAKEQGLSANEVHAYAKATSWIADYMAATRVLERMGDLNNAFYMEDDANAHRAAQAIELLQKHKQESVER